VEAAGAARRAANDTSRRALFSQTKATPRLRSDALSFTVVPDRRPPGPQFDREGQRVAPQPRRLQPRRPARDRGRAPGHDLEPLLELEFERRQPARDRDFGPPPACDLRRDVPEIDVADPFQTNLLLRYLESFTLVGKPLAHVVIVRDDPGAGLEGEDLRAQLHVHLGQQIGRDHRRAREIGLEQVLLAERRPVGDALAHRGLVRDAEQVAVEVDA